MQPLSRLQPPPPTSSPGDSWNEAILPILHPLLPSTPSLVAPTPATQKRVFVGMTTPLLLVCSGQVQL